MKRKIFKIVIWGLGKIYNTHINILKCLELRKEIEIVALTATDIPNFYSVDGYPLIKPCDLSEIQYDYVIIMNDKYLEEIATATLKNGALRKQILTYRMLDIPFLDFREYIKLKESRISIISNNCWGGMIYHTLGMECCSPFKNLFVEDRDYIKLLQNFKYYLQCELKFKHYMIDIHSKERYPVMVLDDILIHCNHESIPEQAVQNWNRRRVKINYENLFIEMYTESKESIHQFLELNQYPKKVCFTPFSNVREDVIQLSLYPGQEEFYQVVNSSAGIGNNSLNYRIIDLLNGKIIYRNKVYR